VAIWLRTSAKNKLGRRTTDDSAATLEICCARSFWLLTQVSGFVFASYGALRESFVDLAQKRVFGEGRFGEGGFGGGLAATEEMLVSLGTKVGLLPPDRTLTATDRKRNAAWAIAGVFLLGLSILFDVWLKYLSRRLDSRVRASRSLK
jgi:hypothetical protein